MRKKLKGAEAGTIAFAWWSAVGTERTFALLISTAVSVRSVSTLRELLTCIRGAFPAAEFTEIAVPEARSSLLVTRVDQSEVGFWCVGAHEPGKRRIFVVETGCRLPDVEDCFEQFELIGSQRFFPRGLKRFPQLTFRIDESKGLNRGLEHGDEPDALLDKLAAEFRICSATTRAEIERDIESLSAPEWAYPSVSATALRALALSWLRQPQNFSQRSQAILEQVRQRDPHYLWKPTKFAEWLAAQLL